MWRLLQGEGTQKGDPTHDGSAVGPQCGPIGTGFPSPRSIQGNVQLTDLQAGTRAWLDGCTGTRLDQSQRLVQSFHDYVERPIADVGEYEGDDVAAGSDQVAGTIKDGQDAGEQDRASRRESLPHRPADEQGL